ncbi:MAG: RimK family alpha-L-glutamate ligase [Desulfarculaceae bacterium]|jgi:ribosomal protein S6--L-glutamate ligase
MRIALITVNDFTFHPNRRLQEAALPRGHEITLINPYRVPCAIGGDALDILGWEDAAQFQVVLPRQGAPIGDYGLALILQLMHMGIPVVNDVHAVRITKDQYLSLQGLAAAGLPVPDTVFVTTEEGFGRAVERLGGFPVVAKQVNSWGGRGVVLVENQRHLEMAADFVLEERKGLVVQRFIPPQGRRDLRALVMGKEVVATMELTPKEGDFRANVHLSGRPQAVDLPLEWKDIAVKAAASLGVEIAGVDMIIEPSGQPRLIEVNHSPGFKGLEAATGMDIAGLMIDYLALTYQT